VRIGEARAYKGKIEQSQAPRYKRGGMSGATLGLVLARDFTWPHHAIKIQIHRNAEFKREFGRACTESFVSRQDLNRDGYGEWTEHSCVYDLCGAGVAIGPTSSPAAC